MKKIISLLLCLALCFSLGTMAFAEDGDDSLRYEDKAISLMSNSDSPDEMLVSKVESGLAVLEQVNVPIESIFNVSSYNGKAIYHRAITEDIVNYLTVSESINGDIVVDYYEDELHDTLTYCADGGILLNGNPVVVTYTDEEGVVYEQPLVARDNPNDFYSEGPCPGTSAGDYTVLDKTRYGNLKLEQLIIDTVTGVLCDLLTEAIESRLPGLGGFVVSTVVENVFNALCSNIKTEALRMAPDSDSVGYKVNYYTTEALVAPLCYSYRHDFYFYLCPVSSSYLPYDMYVGMRQIYHQFTLFW